MGLHMGFRGTKGDSRVLFGAVVLIALVAVPFSAYWSQTHPVADKVRRIEAELEAERVALEARARIDLGCAAVYVNVTAGHAAGCGKALDYAWTEGRWSPRGPIEVTAPSASPSVVAPDPCHPVAGDARRAVEQLQGKRFRLRVTTDAVGVRGPSRFGMVGSPFSLMVPDEMPAPRISPDGVVGVCTDDGGMAACAIPWAAVVEVAECPS